MKSKRKKTSTPKILCLLMAVVLITQITLMPAIGATAHEPETSHVGYYEAEDGILGGRASISDNEDDASGRKMVGNIGGGDEDSGSVTINGVTVEKAGFYEAIIYYATGDYRNFTISVNGEAATTLACNPTGGYSQVGTTTMLLLLSEGSNSITFSSDGWGPNLDRIYVAENMKMYTEDSRSTMQAEDAQLFQGAVADRQSSACAGNGKASDLGGEQNGYVLFDQISIEQSGTYAIDIAYCTKEDRNFLITVDGQQDIWVTCRAGYEWDVPNRCIVTCDLDAGTHSLQFSNPKGYAPNLDEIRLYPCQKYEMGSYTFLLDLETGRYNLIADGHTKLSDAYAAVKVGEILYCGVDYTQHELVSETIQDAFGKGTILRLINKRADWPVLEQQFYLYEGQPYLLMDTKVYWESGETIGTNYIAPLYINSLGGAENEMSGQDYFLRVPYDNDTWVEFELNSVNGSNTGYEAAAILDEATGKAIVMGSLSHDVWKTGISYAGRQNQIDELQMYGGASSALTRD